MARRRMLRAVVLACTAVVVVAGPSPAWAQSAFPPEAFQVLWSKQQPRGSRFSDGEGRRSWHGAALSPDGKSVAYFGEADNPSALPAPVERRSNNSCSEEIVQVFAPQSVEALLLADLGSGRETVLLTLATPGMHSTETSRNFWADYIGHLSFSPDGRRVLFSASGGTIYYPSNIYTLDVDGQNLAKLTRSTRISEEMAGIIGKSIYERYYYAPSYSPDGSRILLAVSETTAEHPAPRDPETGELLGGGGGSRELVGVLKADSSQLEIVAGGVYCFPHFWSADGQSIYYGSNCGEQTRGLIKMNLKTRTAQVIQRELSGRLLGRMGDRDWVAFQLEEGQIVWLNVSSGTPVFASLWSLPLEKTMGGEQFELKGFDWSRSGAVLLWYEGELNERFEVVRFPDGPSNSP